MKEDGIIVTTFAPVFIPTLCRSKHFINLLESLEKCTWAEHTEVYVSLDYPPEEKYVEGHQIIDNYLRKKEECSRFKKLHVFRQSHNLGVSGNFDFLRQYFKNYERYIISEDDNVFSPNYLVFMNKGLEKYKDNHNICAINGYTQPYDFKFQDNSYFLFNNDFCAWGYGSWKSSITSIEQDISNGAFRKSFSIRNLCKVKKHGWAHLRRYIFFCLSRHPYNLRLTDTVLSVYMIVNDLSVVCPRVSTVRNEGWEDNSGNSTSYFQNNIKKEKQQYYASRHINQQIDTNSDFNYYGDPKSFFDYNNRLAAKESSDKMSFFKFIGSFFSLAKGYVKNR